MIWRAIHIDINQPQRPGKLTYYDEQLEALFGTAFPDKARYISTSTFPAWALITFDKRREAEC